MKAGKILLSLALSASLVSVTHIQAKTKVRLSKTKISAVQGKKYTIKMKGTKRKPYFSSTKKSVATVNQKGKISAKKSGTAYIKARLGSKTYKCKVTVKKPYISAKKKTVNIGAASSLSIKNNALKVKWKSSNSQVVTVSSKGKLTANDVGSATIKATVNKKTYTSKITVPKMSMSESNIDMMVGDQEDLDIFNCALTASWTSSDPNVVSVGAGGIVDALAIGSATITASVKNYQYTCQINVVQDDTVTDTLEVPETEAHTSTASTTPKTTGPATRVTDYANAIVGQTVSVKKALTSGKSYSKVKYTTSDESVAIVTSDTGLVMPVSEGTCTITLYSNSKKIKSVDINVTDPGNVEVGIDVSKHNGTVNFATLKSHNVDFAIIRAGNGHTKFKTTNAQGIDLNLSTNIAACEAAGMPYGVYWYCNTNSGTTSRLMTVEEAKTQATTLAETLQNVATSQFTYPIYLDLEQTSALVKSGGTKASRAAYIESICEAYVAVLNSYGYTNIGIYSSTSWYKNNLNSQYFLTGNTSRWLAHYGYNSVTGSKLCNYTAIPSWTVDGVTYYPDLWQTGSSFLLSGLSTYADMNYRYL